MIFHYHMTPQDLYRMMNEEFPVDATSWAFATDEVRDVARCARLARGLGEEQALNFRALNTPSDWNSKGINYAVEQFMQMTEEQRRDFVDSVRFFFPPPDWKFVVEGWRFQLIDGVIHVIGRGPFPNFPCYTEREFRDQCEAIYCGGHLR